MVSVEVVVAHYNEDLKWTENIRKDYKVNIISKNGVPRETPPNKGHEASSYLDFIIKRYDSLPDYTIFVHGHRSDWHHKGNMDEKINNITFNHPYYNINDLGTGGDGYYNKNHLWHIFSSFFEEVGRITGLEMKGDTKILCRPCAQFYINKDIITNTPKDVYIKLYELIMKSGISSDLTGRVFEWTWHYIFTKNPIDID